MEVMGWARTAAELSYFVASGPLTTETIEETAMPWGPEIYSESQICNQQDIKDLQTANTRTQPISIQSSMIYFDIRINTKVNIL
jgi:hypothetical protein